MNVPRGQLVRSRVVEDVGTVLDRALESDLTGYARLESQESLLLEEGGTVVVTFEEGIPMAAYHDGTDAGGTEALDAFAGTRPVGVELYATDPETLAPIHEAEAVAVPPALPAERLATDPGLADRIRETAPEERLRAAAREDNEVDAVASFLDDEARIAQLRSRAREEARERAERWGFEITDE